ncbi:hypothetical protein J7E99_33645 [Streptomyces sp. ISL-44]|uniref:hypothetical protein n=1 Tax=Streptomyces sp. ISL-44 TaxID=2819184 RepID=UPI001BEC9778|nr:hypothetical protein [Streptomyces sp. ISL-44]MBT2545501.1 hypothetical protein [Streptomyces sp. ISL-44]
MLLSQRALITVSGHTDDIAELMITRRLAALAHSDLQAPGKPAVRVVGATSRPRRPHRPAASRSAGGSRSPHCAP